MEAAQQDLGLDGWSHAWNCSTIMKGYSGTAIISRSATYAPSLNTIAAPDVQHAHN